jgi:hypothetical protein
MREAIGGAWLYYIFVVMIIFIVSFLAIFLSYMAAYRACNHAISMLEQSEGKISPAELNSMNPNSYDYNEMEWCYFKPPQSNGYIIKVTAYLKFNIPLVDLPIRIGVTNETRTINCFGQESCSPKNIGVCK